jgi:hypothetical protein
MESLSRQGEREATRTLGRTLAHLLARYPVESRAEILLPEVEADSITLARLLDANGVVELDLDGGGPERPEARQSVVARLARDLCRRCFVMAGS